jgi:hypothetical protein
VDDQHVMDFDQAGMRRVAADLFDVVGYHTFNFGLNQSFRLEVEKERAHPTAAPLDRR